MILKGLLQALVIILFLSGCDESEQQTLPASGVQSSQSTAQTEDGTRRMAQRLNLLADNASPMENSFLNHRRLNHLLSLKQEMADVDTVQQFNQEAAIALEQLRSGRSEQAADSFSRLLDRVRQNPDRFAQNMPRRLRALKAIALMRQGEQSNCVALHMSRSCIFPIDSAAVSHQSGGFPCRDG